MKTPTELQLRKVALVLTGAVVLVAFWSGASLLLLSEPEPILPAAASLQVDEVKYAAPLSAEESREMVARPIFWQGREVYTPPAAAPKKNKAGKQKKNTDIDDVELHGMYAADGVSGVIVSYKNERQRLQLDESVAGWTFTMLSDAGAVFENGEDVRELPLEHATPAPSKKQNKEKKEKKAEIVEPDETLQQDETGE